MLLNGPMIFLKKRQRKSHIVSIKLIEADFGYFMDRSDSITKDQTIEYTHTKAAKACGCGTLNIHFRMDGLKVLEAGFDGALSVPNQVILNDICCFIEGMNVLDLPNLNYNDILTYTLPTQYHKCFHRFILKTFFSLVEEVREKSSSNHTETRN